MQGRPSHIVMLGPFGMAPKATMRARALPLAQVLVARGYRVTLLLPPWDNPADSGKRWTAGGVEVINIVLPRRLRFTGITHRLYRAINELRPHLIHTFKPKGYGALVAAGLARRVPILLDSDDWEGRGGWNERGHYSVPQRLVFDWQERTLPRLARAVTVASRTLESQMWGIGVSPARVVYVPNGLTTVQEKCWPADPALARLKRAELGLEDRPVVLLYTRFVEFAPQRAAEVFSRVRAQLPAAHLLLIGSGLRGEEQVMAAELRRTGAGDAVTHIPWVPQEELAATLAVGDVAILPYDDTLINRAKCSVKTLELMAAGLPVVADAVGQNTAYFEHQTSGVLIEPGNTESFAAAVGKLLGDHDRRTRLVAAAARRVRSCFTWSGHADRVAELYDSVLGQQR